jgi:hypothetical protein
MMAGMVAKAVVTVVARKALTLGRLSRTEKIGDDQP